MRSALIAASLAGTLLVAACDLLPSKPTQSYGTLVVEWAEDQDDSQLVRDAGVGLRQVKLLRSQAEWDEFIAALPPAMQQSRAAEVTTIKVDSGEFLLVGRWDKCEQEARVIRESPGVMVLDVYYPGGGNPLTCEWSPERLQVWELEVADAGVNSTDDLLDPVFSR